jgi:predicted ArsR family transcriptional regulator
MARVEPLTDSDGFLFVENHCPICAAARACSGLCRSELEVFRGALGDGVTVERTDHILAGARRCAYRVTPCAAQAESAED